MKRTSLQQFFQPFVVAAHRAETRIHIYCGRSCYAAGYISGVDETSVEKYIDGSNSTVRVQFDEIDRLVVTNRDGRELMEFKVSA